MPPSTPFVDQSTGALDTRQILLEAIPLAKLIGLFVAIALVPLTVVFLFGGNSVLGALLMVVAQFVLAVGSAVVLLYVIARAIRLADGR